MTIAIAIYEAEIAYQELQYKELSDVEKRIMFYPPVLSKKCPFGFYTRADYPTSDHIILDAMNAELKNFLIFNGAPEPLSKEWDRLVEEHRKKSQDEILQAYVARMAEAQIHIEQIQVLYGGNGNGTQ